MLAYKPYSNYKLIPLGNNETPFCSTWLFPRTIARSLHAFSLIWISFSRLTLCDGDGGGEGDAKNQSISIFFVRGVARGK